MEPLQLESNNEHLEKTAKFFRMQTDAQLSRAIAHPQSLVGSLEGYPINHNNTAASRIAVQLAEDELKRRREAPSLRLSKIAIGISIVAALIALGSMAKGVWWGVG
ncbi:MAG: hypothetical protein HY246_22555 [Proteobacteria bacterium]|nr:hypothetical protein [Pseudomonadota bacterium]